MIKDEHGFVLISVLLFLMLTCALFITTAQALQTQYRMQHLLMQSYDQKAQSELVNHLSKNEAEIGDESNQKDDSQDEALTEKEKADTQLKLTPAE